MRRLFRSFEKRGVGYLLISGQACVLYGASISSEDFDIWLRPMAKDLAAMIASLRDVGALVHKLTPPMTVANLRKGHGLHFRLPDEALGVVYLDVMGRPPRTGTFARSLRRAEWIDTGWAKVPVVCMEDLVEIKKTRRPPDYEPISNLARLRLQRAIADGASPRELARVTRWSLDNAFRLDAMLRILHLDPGAHALAKSARRASLRTLAKAWSPGVELLDADVEERIARELNEERMALEKADSDYWRPIIHELRELRRHGKLLAAGEPV